MLKAIALNHPTGNLWKVGFEAALSDIDYKIKNVDNINEEISTLKSSNILLCNTLLDLNGESKKFFDKLILLLKKQIVSTA